VAVLVVTAVQRARIPVLLCALVGLGGLFAGVTGPLLSNFVPLIVRDAIGEHRTAIGGVMAIDNVLLLLLVPWAGAASDRAIARGRGRLPIVLGAFVLAAAGMALFPAAPAFGFGGVVCAMVVLYAGINVQRSPFHAMMTDLVPSRYRSLANASVTFQMCAGAIVFLMLGKILGMRPAFLVAAGTVLAIVAVFGLALPRPAVSESQAAEAPYRSLFDAVSSAIRGAVPGLRAVFIATFLQQLTFQTFTTWFALHGTERFGVRPEEVTTGFIAWALGGVIGALPAGVIGVRVGRRNAMLLGFAMMAISLLALDRVTQLLHATVLLALASACWTLPMVNAYPLFVEPVAPASRGVLTALFVLCMALGGAIGDPLNGALFDLAGGYRPMFLMMAAYTTLAFVTLLFIPRGAGEAAAVPNSP
jgi:maltose/moltooligosaccharide transporter